MSDLARFPEEYYEDSIPTARLDVIRASDVTLARVLYAWAGRVPIGAVTLMPGEEGIGKTTIGGRVLADITRGELDGEYHGTPRDVVLLAAEDGLADVLVPRLAAAGADLERVHIVKARISITGDEGEVILPRDLHLVSDLVRERQAAMVWIDSLVTTLPDELKSISYKDTAKVLKALNVWAEQERVALVAPWHLNKTSGADTAHRIMDSRAFRTAVRSMLLVVPDPDAPEGTTQGIVALDKANAGTLNVPALRYRLNSHTYTVREHDPRSGVWSTVPASCAVVEWLGEVEGGRAAARELLSTGGTRNDVDQWLADYLNQNGTSDSREIRSAGEALGYSERRLRRGASRIGVVMVEAPTVSDDGRTVRRTMWQPSGPVRTPAPDTSTPSSTSATSEPPLTREREDIHTLPIEGVRTVRTSGTVRSEPSAPETYCEVCGFPTTGDDRCSDHQGRAA